MDGKVQFSGLVRNSAGTSGTTTDPLPLLSGATAEKMCCATVNAVLRHAVLRLCIKFGEDWPLAGAILNVDVF